MQKLTEIVLFTNGVVLAFDENGMTHPFQENIAETKRYNYKKEDVVKELLETEVEIKISRWQQWVHPINKEEFFLLTDMYKEYKSYRKKMQSAEPNQPQTADD